MNAAITKILVFTVLGGIGAFIGSLLGYPIAHDASGLTEIIFRTGLWDALIAIGIGIAFIWSQNWYLKQARTGAKPLVKIAGICAVAGFAGGITLVILRYFMRDFPAAVSLAIAWGFEGLIIGFLIAPVIPNLPRRSALLAGAIAGSLGAMTMLGINAIGLEGAVSVAVGDSLKGIFLGLLFPVTETLVREAWLEVHYGPQEVRNVTLGNTPISIGSNASSATIYAAQVAPLASRYRLSQGQVVCEDIPAQTTRRLFDGDQQTFGKLKVVVRTVQSRRELAPVRSDHPQHQLPLSLHFKRQVFSLQEGNQLQSQQIPGLEPQGTDRVVAEVNRHPQNPALLGLKNKSYQAWSAILATGEQKRIEPGRTVKLEPGTRINFGAVEGEIKS